MLYAFRHGGEGWQMLRLLVRCLFLCLYCAHLMCVSVRSLAFVSESSPNGVGLQRTGDWQFMLFVFLHFCVIWFVSDWHQSFSENPWGHTLLVCRRLASWLVYIIIFSRGVRYGSDIMRIVIFQSILKIMINLWYNKQAVLYKNF